MVQVDPEPTWPNNVAVFNGLLDAAETEANIMLLKFIKHFNNKVSVQIAIIFYRPSQYLLVDA